jgi:AcrR family transcriptional regulator
MSSKEKNTRTRILHATWQLMEQHLGKTISMSDVAKAVGISRQAVYLHFESRTELMVATSSYVDEIKGLKERLQQFKAASTGTEMLDACIDIWGNYIPEIYGLAKALMTTRNTDDATAAVWDGNMGTLRGVCSQAITTLHCEGKLVQGFTVKQGVDLFWTMLSVSNWEQLILECGWTNEQYIKTMKQLAKQTFVK